MNSDNKNGETIASSNEKTYYGVSVGSPEIKENKLTVNSVAFEPGPEMDEGNYSTKNGNIQVKTNPELISMKLIENTREDDEYLKGIEEGQEK